MAFDPKKCTTTHVGKNLKCDWTQKFCPFKTKNCIEDCEKLLKEYYVYQEQFVELTEYAENFYCKRCSVKDCKIFASGNFVNCMRLVMAFMDGGA